MAGEGGAAASLAMDLVQGEPVILREWSLALLGIAALDGISPAVRQSQPSAEDRRKLLLRIAGQ
jgi:hypothetical protein